MFTQKCVLDKTAADLQSVEATPVALDAVGANHEFEIGGAVGTQYAFILVEKPDGSLHDVTVTNVAGQPTTAQRVAVHNAQPLVRDRTADKQVWGNCK